MKIYNSSCHGFVTLNIIISISFRVAFLKISNKVVQGKRVIAQLKIVLQNDKIHYEMKTIVDKVILERIVDSLLYTWLLLLAVKLGWHIKQTKIA